MKRAIVLVGCALSLAACSTGSKAAVSTTPAVVAVAPSTVAKVAPPATTSPAAPTMWTIPAAAQKYTAMVAAANVNVNKLKALPDSATVGQYTALCTKIAADVDVLARSVSAGRWPAAAQAPIAAYIPVVLTLREDFIVAARDKTMVALASDLQTAGADNTKEQSASEAVRIALGLPSD
jgi:hypothetical protein